MKVIKYRPFYALAAACGLASAILIGSPALGKQPIKPTPKPASSCCDYDANESPGQTFQPDCIEAVELQANSVIQLKAVEDNTFISGYWSADWGTINQSGQYTAPSFMPPAGFDTVTFTYETGGEYRTSFQIIQQPGVPFTASPDGISYSDIEIQRLQQLQQAHNFQEIGIDDQPVDTKSDQTDAPYDLDNFEDAGTIAPILLQNNTYIPLGTRGSIVPITILAQSSVPAKKRKKCRVLPTPSWAGNPCTNGTKRAVEGPVKYSRKGEPTRTSSALPIPGGGSAEVSFWVQRAVAYKYKDVYVCVDGVWRYSHSKKCTIDCQKGWGFNPQVLSGTATGIALGFDLWGYQFDWSNPLLWECTDY